MAEPAHPFVLYQTEGGRTAIELTCDAKDVWLSAAQLAQLFQRSRSVISRHIENIFAAGELDRASSSRGAVVEAGTRDGAQNVDLFGVDMVIAVACRVRSHRGKQFRSWATRRLSEYIVKGFMLDDERLKHANEGRYFAELASRLDDIRRSSRAPWRKLLGIYATSIDYDPETPTSHSFFTAVDEKLRGGRHMADSGAENSEPFVSASLDQIATVCLEFAHLQAANGTPMYMADWAAKVVELSVKPRAG